MRVLPIFYELNLTNEDIVEMMREDGITYQEIALYIKAWDRKKVSKYAESLPICDFPKIKPFSGVLENDHIECSICGRLSSSKEMPKRSYNSFDIYYQSYCLLCLNANPKENPLERKSVARALAIREKAFRNDKKASLEEIPRGYFAFLFSKQRGQCFYTGDTLSFREREDMRNGLSVDRVIYNGKYEQGNIVFVLNKVNAVKSDMTIEEMSKWTPKWHERATHFLERKQNYLLEVNNAI